MQKCLKISKYGEASKVMAFSTMPKPVPKANQILIQVKASTVAVADYRLSTMDVPWGLSTLVKMQMGFSAPKMKVLGREFSGVVVECGDKVKLFKIGDEVFGDSGETMGCYSEYICVDETAAGQQVGLKPENISIEESAALPLGMQTALDSIRNKNLGNIKEGDKVLVYGASGNVGTYAVQLGKYFKGHVTAVCSKRNFDFVRSLGADEVLDYAEDFNKFKQDLFAKGEQFDIVLICAEALTIQDMFKILKKNGRAVLIILDLSMMLRIVKNKLARSLGLTSKILTLCNEGPSQKDMKFIKDVVESGEIRVVVDSILSVKDFAKGFEKTKSGRKTGGLVLTMDFP